MKLSNFLFFALLGLFISVAACKSQKEEVPVTDQTTVMPDGGSLSTSPPAVETPTAGNSTEAHYKCPNNCEGGVGSAAGKCPICGTEMVHNAAFHAQAGAEPGSSPQTPITIDPKNATNPAASPATSPTVQPPATAAQNAKGDWHYTCSNNCGGGAGAAGNCPKCGSPLAHNQAYHQQ